MYDAYAAMYACIKQASDQIGMVTEQEAASFIPGVRPGRTLAEDVGGLQPRSTSHIEVPEMDTSVSTAVIELRAWMAAKDQELQGARQLAARQAGEVREYARSEDRNATSLSSISGT